MSARSRSFAPGGADAGAHQQDRGQHGKAEQRQRRGQNRDFLAIEVEQGRDRVAEAKSAAKAGRARGSALRGESDQAVACQRSARQQRPTHRPDYARHHLPQERIDSARAHFPTARESIDNIAKRTRRVRVQTVNGNRAGEKTVWPRNANNKPHSPEPDSPQICRQLPVVNCIFITVMMSFSCVASSVVRFTSSAPCKAPKTNRASLAAGARA